MPTVRVPIDLRTPGVALNAGNAYHTVGALTAWDAGRWEYLRDVDGDIYGMVAVPKNLAATPAPAVILLIAANAEVGVTRLLVATKAIADGELVNPLSLTAETAQDITVPATARLRRDVRFPATGSLGEAVAADDLLVVKISHVGSHANDTLAVPTELYGAWLQTDIV